MPLHGAVSEALFIEIFFCWLVRPAFKCIMYYYSGARCCFAALVPVLKSPVAKYGHT